MDGILEIRIKDTESNIWIKKEARKNHKRKLEIEIEINNRRIKINWRQKEGTRKVMRMWIDLMHKEIIEARKYTL